MRIMMTRRVMMRKKMVVYTKRMGGPFFERAGSGLFLAKAVAVSAVAVRRLAILGTESVRRI